MCENEKKKTSSIEMTSGSLWKNILLFSLPLMGSQVLEVLFNISDVAVVGRFADYMALGAVGSTTLLVTLFTGILIGMGAGVNVRVAHELGAENRKGTEETIHTSLLLCAIAGLLVCVVCLLFSAPSSCATRTLTPAPMPIRIPVNKVTSRVVEPTAPSAM